MAKAKKGRSDKPTKRNSRGKHNATAVTYRVALNDAKELDKAKLKIRRRCALLVSNSIEIGYELRRIKKLLRHGTFRIYVTNEFPFSLRKAQICMNCVPIAQQNPEIIGKLQATVLYELAAPSTPVSIRDRVCADMRAGQECPSVKTIKLWIKQERESKSPAPETNTSGDEPDLDFSLETEVLRNSRGFELSASGSELLSMFIGNIPREELGAAARLLGTLCYIDLKTIVSKIRFKALRSQQLSRPDAEMEADCAFGA